MSGKFITGEVVVKWLDDGRKMELVKGVVFQDQFNDFWAAPVGAIIDGASIPRRFWRLIGSPFVGKYRRASIVHDYYCEIKTRHWKDTHRVFYEMMQADGVSSWLAFIMYKAVYCFGPRWEHCGEVSRNNQETVRG